MTSIVNEERLPWHTPEIQRLVVTLDTKNDTGSGPDAEGLSTFI